MDKNLKAYIKLDKSKLVNQYVVIVEGKTIATGLDIEKMLKTIRRRYPNKTPFVAKIPEPKLLVLINPVREMCSLAVFSNGINLK